MILRPVCVRVGHFASGCLERLLTERESVASDLVVRSGGVYLVGSLRRAEHKRRRGLSDVLGLHDEASERTAQVWLRVFRIAGPTGE